MELIFHKHFEKKFKKLSQKDKDKVLKTIEIFTEDPLDSSLHNHQLSGFLKGKRAFSVKGDLRIIFELLKGYEEVLILDIGSHNQVY